MGMVAELLVVHHPTGLILRKHQKDDGIARLQASVRAGELERVVRGVYVRKGSRSVFELFKLRAAAVGLTHPSSIITGPAGCALHDIAYIYGGGLRVDVICPYGSGTSKGRHVDRRAETGPVQVDDVDGIRVTTPARTVIETCLVHGARAGTIAAESALWLGRCTPEQLHDELAAQKNRKGRVHAVAAIGHAGNRSQSPGESLTSMCLEKAGLRGFTQQVNIYDENGRWVATVDFFDPDVGFVIEFDGDVKTSGQYGDPVEVARAQLRRHDALANLGLFILHLKWADVVHGRIIPDLRETHAQRVNMGKFFRGRWRPATREELLRAAKSGR